jgi:hypothetical protein
MKADYFFWAEEVEWDDNEGCYIWGKHVKGDAKADKCMLCEGREFKEGTGSLKRHIAHAHGLDCGVLPPVTDEAMRKHREKKAKAKADAGTKKRSAEEAGLDDKESDEEMQDVEEGDEAEVEVDDDDVLEDFFKRATGARGQDADSEEE